MPNFGLSRRDSVDLSDARAVNWKRGLFRVWMLLSAGWIMGWKRNGWKTADRKPVKNAELWHALDEARQRHQVTWHWVKGHAGHPENERADELARQGMAPFKKPGKVQAVGSDASGKPAARARPTKTAAKAPRRSTQSY